MLNAKLMDKAKSFRSLESQPKPFLTVWEPAPGLVVFLNKDGKGQVVKNPLKIKPVLSWTPAIQLFRNGKLMHNSHNYCINLINLLRNQCCQRWKYWNCNLWQSVQQAPVSQNGYHFLFKQMDGCAWKLKTHIVGVLVNHHSLAYALIDLCKWGHDSNLTINVLLPTFADVKKSVDQYCSFPFFFHFWLQNMKTKRRFTPLVIFGGDL